MDFGLMLRDRIWRRVDVMDLLQVTKQNGAGWDSYWHWPRMGRPDCQSLISCRRKVVTPAPEGPKMRWISLPGKSLSTKKESYSESLMGLEILLLKLSLSFLRRALSSEGYDGEQFARPLPHR